MCNPSIAYFMQSSLFKALEECCLTMTDDIKAPLKKVVNRSQKIMSQEAELCCLLVWENRGPPRAKMLTISF